MSERAHKHARRRRQQVANRQARERREARREWERVERIFAPALEIMRRDELVRLRTGELPPAEEEPLTWIYRDGQTLEVMANGDTRPTVWRRL